MSDTQVRQLVKMAEHITRNMAAEGDDAALKAAEHIRKFWTPAMREQLIEHSQTAGAEVPPLVRQVVELLRA